MIPKERQIEMSRTKDFAAELAEYVYRRHMSPDQILAILTDEKTAPRQIIWLRKQIQVVKDNPDVFQPLAEDDFRRWRW